MKGVPASIRAEAAHGLLLLDKPKGLTSHDLVLAARRRMADTKIGHSGTLDPMARGLLVLLVGSATKCAALYQKLPKVYSGRIRLGLETDSGDLAGKPVREAAVPELTLETIQRAMDGFLGPREMLPPMYSAVKHKGKPLYAYARKGIEVPLKPRPCEIYSWKALGWDKSEIEFRLHCSHGTYARALAVELGRALGTVAVLSELFRESIGAYQVADAISNDTLARLPLAELVGRLLPVDIAALAPFK